MNIFQRIRDFCWLQPSLYHHFAQAACALEKYDKAVEFVRLAVLMKYDRCDRLFEEEELSRLHGHEEFQLYKRLYEEAAPAPVPHELMQAITNRPGNLFGGSISQLSFKYYFYDPNKNFTLPPLFLKGITPEEYKKLLEKFFDHYFLQDIILTSSENVRKIYRRYKDYESLSPEAHYTVLKKIHYSGHSYQSSHQNDLDLCVVISQKLRQSLSHEKYAERNKRMKKKYKNDSFFHHIILGKQY
ncbi:MAG: hypothetical protein PQJ60_13070 [Spirochaetales bacterium]|nr:hypothetical protein [Spirochaetales bacterium]